MKTSQVFSLKWIGAAFRCTTVRMAYDVPLIWKAKAFRYIGRTGTIRRLPCLCHVGAGASPPSTRPKGRANCHASVHVGAGFSPPYIRAFGALGILGLTALLLLLFIPVKADAHSGLVVNVKVVRATRDTVHVDPELAGLAREVGPVLNFTGFSLIKKSEIPLSADASQRLFLPADRSMRLELAGFEKDQARLKIVIYKKETEIFTTTLLLVDNGSALIGGPKLENGVMMIRISGRFTP